MTEQKGKVKRILGLAPGRCDRNLFADAICQRESFLASPAGRLANY